MEHQRLVSLEGLRDTELLNRLRELVVKSRTLEADLVAHIGEVDRRRLYARFAVPSMFAYCTEVLHLSEASAYRRITVARAARDCPALLDMLADGRLHLSGLARLVPHLTPENRDSVLARAVHRSKREIEELVAALAPRADVAAAIRKLPERAGAAGTLDSASGPGATVDHDVITQPVPGPVVATPSADRPAPGAVSMPSAIEPLAPSRYKVQFTAGEALRDKLERLRALMRSSVPDGDLAAIIDAAVTEKLQRLESRRFGSARGARRQDGEPAQSSASPSSASSSSTPSSRHIPAGVRRAVREREGDRCGFVDTEGRRCTGRGALEYHHRRPYAHGGDHTVGNVALLCRSHNAYLAEIDYGENATRRRARRRCGPDTCRRPH